MGKIKVDIYDNLDDYGNISSVCLSTKIGKFWGSAIFNSNEDKFKLSRSIGVDIAEARARIAYINKQLENKRQELKGITRLLNSMPKDNPGYSYAKGTERAILKEIEELKDKKQYCKNYIDRKIEGRKIFIRSRSLTKEEKAETVKKIKEGFKALSDYNKTKQ